MAVPRKNVMVRIPEPAHAMLERLCGITHRSQAQLIEIFLRNWETTWLDRFTAEEKARYLAGEMDFSEAGKIRQRATAPQPPQAA
jgi:hypothetical protein